MPTLLQARHLLKFYGGHEAVHDVSLDIARGSLTAIIGPNGAGKSTTISMLIGVASPDAGTVEFPHFSGTDQSDDAHNPSHETFDNASDSHGSLNSDQAIIRGNRRTWEEPTGKRPAIGVVFQQSVLDPLLTARENLTTRAHLYHEVPGKRVDEVIGLVHAERFADQRYGSLSGGQRRSIDIARALLNNPDLLVLDEPTTGLDIVTRNALWQLLNRLRHETGLSILLTTHYLEEAEHADQVYLIDHGRIKASGSAAELVSRYADYRLAITLKPGAEKTTANHTRNLAFTLADARACMETLDRFRPYIADFECRPGTMNDVFLTLTK